ncbi:hypothetical protein GYMLUDRAFT_415268 [Collybiopsis luxurians FD-317 M1]|nr:hypothetical protein GYMLUDRAFT_415268 [Collybiopsis luxurians FD-317 M1]
MIAQACIIYIMHVAEREEKTDRHQEFPLWNYACQYWPVHARTIEGKQQGGPLESLTKDILTDSCNSFLQWREQYDQPDTWLRWEIGTALYYAAENGLIKRVDDILKEKRWACHDNKESKSNVVSYINGKCGRWGNALQAAVQQDHKWSHGLQYEVGSEYLTAQGGQYINTHQVHLKDSIETVVQLLLENGADVNAQGSFYGTALHAATEKGNEAVVKLLLENGADVNAQGGDYGNALVAAAQGGNEAVVKLLLENGADVSAQGGEYGNALQALHREAMKLLSSCCLKMVQM